MNKNNSKIDYGIAMKLLREAVIEAEKKWNSRDENRSARAYGHLKGAVGVILDYCEGEKLDEGKLPPNEEKPYLHDKLNWSEEIPNYQSPLKPKP